MTEARGTCYSRWRVRDKTEFLRRGPDDTQSTRLVRLEEVSAGLLITVTVPAAAGAIGGLLLAGFAIAPVVPTTLSLAGCSAPGRSGQAVATTTAGYSAFIISPLALALLILTSLAIASVRAENLVHVMRPGGIR